MKCKICNRERPVSRFPRALRENGTGCLPICDFCGPKVLPRRK